MIPELLATFRDLGKTWREEASRRRRATPTDAGAEAMEYCAAELVKHVEQLRSGLHRVSVEQFAKLRKVSEQTVRNWIHRGLLPAERGTNGGFLIDPNAVVLKAKAPESRAS